MRTPTVYSKISVKSRMVLPAEVRERLAVGPGDRPHCVSAPDGVRLERAPPAGEDPLVAFTEWAGTVDDEDHVAL